MKFQFSGATIRPYYPPEEGIILIGLGTIINAGAIVVGGLLGALMQAALALCNPYEIIQEQHVWGARMLILASARPREGLVQTLLILAQLFSMLIGAVSTLCAAAQALETAFPKLRFFSLWLCAALLLGALMATAFFGMDVLLAVSPFLLIPEGILIGISFFKKAPS